MDVPQCQTATAVELDGLDVRHVDRDNDMSTPNSLVDWFPVDHEIDAPALM